MGWLNQFFQGGKTTIAGDTLVADVAHFKTTGAINAGGPITGTTVSDANGPVVARQAQIYQFPEQDISAAGATVLGPMLPTGGHITRAWYGVTETFGTMTTGAVQIGSASDVDAHVVGTTDEAHGLLTTGKTAGSYVALALTGVEGATIAPGERLSVSHVQCAVAGAVCVIVEYVLA
jgi:hypothetical protein